MYSPVTFSQQTLSDEDLFLLTDSHNRLAQRQWLRGALIPFTEDFTGRPTVRWADINSKEDDECSCERTTARLF